MIFDELFFSKLDRVKITDGDDYIYFYNYMDRLWCEIGQISNGEILFESQITIYKELYTACDKFCQFTNFHSTHAFVGMITEKLFTKK